MKITLLIIGGILAVTLPAVAAISGEEVFSELNAGFELLDGDGKAVTLSSFRGKNVLLAFGFTHCHHICPMNVANMERAIKASDKEAVGIFVSVDNERDSPAITDAYAQSFGENMIGLGGSYEQIVTAVKNFAATFVVTKSEKHYTVQHTPSIFLISPDGDILAAFAMNTPTAEITAAMR